MPVTKRVFDGRLKRLREATPVLSGFVQDGMSFTRQGEDLLQVIEFQPGHGGYRERFTFNEGWKLLRDAHASIGFLCWQRPHFFVGGGNVCYSRANTQRLDQSLDYVASTLVEKVVPFLDAHRTIASLVARVERGETEAEVAFGIEPVMRGYAHSRCLYRLGRVEESLRVLREAIATADERALAHVPPAYCSMLEHARALLAAGGA